MAQGSVAYPYNPIAGSTVSISATTTSANVAIPANALNATSVRVAIVSGTAGCRWRAGVGSGTAAVSGDPYVFPTTAESFSIPQNSTHIAAKTDSGTCTIEFTFGFGS